MLQISPSLLKLRAKNLPRPTFLWLADDGVRGEGGEGGNVREEEEEEEGGGGEEEEEGVPIKLACRQTLC